MNFFKTSFWSAIATAIKVLAGLVTTKILAIFVGPNGVALLGNFTNILSTLSSFSNGAISSGITKYVSEFDEDEDKRSVVIHSIKINLICSAVLGVVIIAFHRYFSRLIFENNKYDSIFIMIGLTIVFFGLNATISAVYNGYRQIKYLILTGIIGSVLSVILAIIFTIRFGLYGALINTIITQVLIFLINIIVIRKLQLFHISQMKMKFNKVLLWKLFKYGAMSIVSTFVVPMSTLIIRKYITYHYSTNEAGYVQGVWSISAAYLMVVTTTLSIYYLPTLSSIKDKVELRKEIFRGYKFILPLTVLGGVAIFLCRDIVIYILYTSEFLPMKQYFTFQIIGDMFKIASYLLAYLMIAKAMTKWYILTEILFSALYVGLSLLFVKLYGPVGVTYAYTCNYIIYLIFMLVLFKGLIFQRNDKKGAVL